MKNIKTHLLSKASLFIIAIALVFAASYVSADYQEPGSSAPTCPAGSQGCDTPVNVGSTGQVKTGSLSVNAFTAYMNSWFDQNVSVKGTIGGVTGTPQASVAAPLSVSTDLKVAPLAGTGDRITCADSNGQFKVCGTQFYTNIEDIVAFTVQWNGSSWFLSSSQVLFTTNPSHVSGWTPIAIRNSTRTGVGNYYFSAVFGPGTNEFNIDATEIVSAQIVDVAGWGTYKIGLTDESGNNRIGIVTSDDNSAGDIPSGTKIKFIYVSPSVR